MNKSTIDAVIFDLDGVITNSTPLHSLAWKKMFDQFLSAQAEKTSTPFREFTHEDDYLAYIDGKPRYIGVESFLESRGIELPYGDPTQEPGQDTICALGNQKNEIYNQLLTDQGVEIYASSVEFIHSLKDEGIPVGLATSSKNAVRVLEKTGLSDLFQARVDGIVSAELGLEGKPSPDIFQTACDQLHAAYDRSVIVEDANSGVEAGYRGHFGLVLGVARENNQEELELHGADLVVKDLHEITLDEIYQWFALDGQKKSWSIEYSAYDLAEEGTRETLCAVGNGYFCTRGAMEELPATLDKNYPGTYIAGLYNRLQSNISGRTISNEDFVNSPNWLPLTFRVGTGDWFNPNKAEILDFHRKLDFKTGLLARTMVVRDGDGNQTRIQSTRFISMADRNIAAIEYTVTPLNYTGTITVRSELDGTIANLGVKRYRDLSARHLLPQSEGGQGEFSYLSVKTNQSGIEIGLAAKHQVALGEEFISPEFSVSTIQGKVTTTFEVDARSDSPVRVHKLVSLYSSNLPRISDPLESAQVHINNASGFQELLERSISAWNNIWDQIDLKIKGDRLVQKMIRLHLYHSLVSFSPHSTDLDVGIPARGLHGEAYRGHIFWDELYVMPFYDLHFPDNGRSALMYRYNRLPAARQSASKSGKSGAQFPWQSGSDGSEETQRLHLNPVSGKWGPDYSHLQRHVSLAIAYNLWTYYWITGDEEFLTPSRAELYLSICQYWSSMAEKDPQSNRYSITGVVGPDEFHEKYPDSDTPGLRNNAYTNLMAAWTFNKAFSILEIIPQDVKDNLLETLGIKSEELLRWDEIARELSVSLTPEGILEQFQGYFDLEELDWSHYKKTYNDIHRMDRILKSEGLSPNSFKVSKQADALMLFFNLPNDTIKSLLDQIGYKPADNLLSDNLHYYLQRTSHGSTLSRLVHAYLAFLVENHDLSWKLYQEALRSDYLDIQGGTTREGIHLGVMTGTILHLYRTFAGLSWSGELLEINPKLPSGWKQIAFNVVFKGSRYHLEIEPDQVKMKTDSEDTRKVIICHNPVSITPGDWLTIKYSST